MKREGIVTVDCLVLLVIIIFFCWTPVGREIWNQYTYSLEKIDEKTYKERKVVEDTARSMIAVYKSDVKIYEQYKDSEDKEKQSWAEQAKMRANRTANTYNEYMLKNSYMWKNNIPNDIVYELDIVE